MNLSKNRVLDTIWFGIFVGVLLPFFMSIIAVLARSREMDFIAYFKQVWNFGVYADTLRISALIDLLAFYLLLNRKLYSGAKGVIAGVIIVGLFVVYLKFM